MVSADGKPFSWKPPPESRRTCLCPAYPNSACTLREISEDLLCGRAADNTEDLPKQLFISRGEKRLRERVLQKDIFRQPLKVSLESWKPAVNRGVHHCLLPFSSLTTRAGHPDVNSLGFLRSCPSPSRVMGFPHPNSQSPGLEKGLRTEALAEACQRTHEDKRGGWF